ncbi:MAG: LAGLIDADG family homing endonuclease, partial [Candidatus Diapherotrites archaeon]|nr:LAGLIDADG family homing endonuclease [Candidatus Diapherotrites archaeon]
MPLKQLNRMLALLSEEKQMEFRKRIDEKQVYLSTYYSQHKMKFPNQLSPELCYVIGLLLGDGTISGGGSNGYRCWRVELLFDNADHSYIYEHIFQRIFELNLRRYPQKGCTNVCCNSFIAHWFFRSFFGLHQGRKADKIEMPVRILKTADFTLINSCIRGLFDSDGCFAPSDASVRYASTSKKMVDQVSSLLESQGVKGKRYQWLKDPKYKMLYDIRYRGHHSLRSFSALVGFWHPLKDKKL